jgi:hypothetical protein
VLYLEPLLRPQHDTQSPCMALVLTGTGLTLGVAPAVPRLPSKYNHGLAGAALSAGTSVSKPFAATAPEIQELIMSMFKVRGASDAHLQGTAGK